MYIIRLYKQYGCLLDSSLLQVPPIPLLNHVAFFPCPQGILERCLKRERRRVWAKKPKIDEIFAFKGKLTGNHGFPGEIIAGCSSTWSLPWFPGFWNFNSHWHRAINWKTTKVQVSPIVVELQEFINHDSSDALMVRWRMVTFIQNDIQTYPHRELWKIHSKSHSHHHEHLENNQLSEFNCHTNYPLVNVYITMEKHHARGKSTISTWQVSIANCKKLPEGIPPPGL